MEINPNTLNAIRQASLTIEEAAKAFSDAFEKLLPLKNDMLEIRVHQITAKKAKKGRSFWLNMIK